MHSKFLFVLIGTAVAVIGLSAEPAHAQTCIGFNCGPTVLMCCTMNPSNHCRENNQGTECWDAIGGAAACEAMGFVNQCSFAPPISQGGDATLAPTALGGFNTFRTQILSSATSRAKQDAARQDQAEAGREGGGVFTDIITSLERDDWTFQGTDGETNGIRFGWRRQGERGGLFGFSASYQESDPDQGESSELLSGTVNFGHTIGSSRLWKWSIFGTVNDISGPASDTLLGGGGQIYFNRYFESGSVFSGGVLYTYQTADKLQDDPQTVGYGLAYGFPIAQRFALDLDAFGVTIIDPDVQDDFFYTLSGIFSIYFTPRFTLNLGYRVLEGIDGLDSDTLTIGSSSRW